MTDAAKLDDLIYIEDSRQIVQEYYAEFQQEDESGDEALWQGGGLYDEAMGITDPDLIDARLDSFRGAELLYREAASKGNLYASMNLGYVYSYDRCRGLYWPDERTLEVSGARESREQSNARAFKSFKMAADGGLAEACYKLGDCYKNGIGCDIDEHEAYLSYKKAAKFDDDGAAYLTGSIALRLAGCLEEGIGCEHDFKRALKQYEIAEKFLDAAVSSGDDYYNGALRGARDGIVRCKQEIALLE